MNNSDSKFNWYRQVVAFLLLIVVSSNFGGLPLFAQRVVFEGGEFGGFAPAPIPSTSANFDDDLSAGSALKTDPDLESILKKAEQYRKDGNWRIAAKLWQTVLERGGDALYTDDKQMYYSMTRKVESVIGKLPKDGLEMYRGTADAGATEVLARANGPNDVETLSKVVKQFFMSSSGDDAAYRLGCIYLDRFDFVGAIRVFEKIARDYPDPSIPMDQLWLRLAVAYAYTGNINNANQALEKARAVSDNPESARIRQIEKVVRNAQVMVADSIADGEWSMRHGGPLRYGLMPELPDDYLSGDLVPQWMYRMDVAKTYDKDNYLGKVFAGADAISENALKPMDSESSFWKQWQGKQWRPAGELLLVDGKAIFKTGADLVAFDGNAGQQHPVWRSSFLNRFELDDATKTYQQMKQMYGGRLGGGGFRGGGGPVSGLQMTNEQIQFFGDRIHQSMSVNRGVVYTLEGKEYHWNKRPRNRGTARRSYQWGVVPRRTRTNYLAAYDLKTGKYLWRVPEIKELESSKPKEKKQDDGESNEIVEGGFMAAPIAFGSLLLVPVNQGGAIWIYALDSQNRGQTVWKSYLCDEPSAGSDPWSPIVLTLDGSDLYVTCGTGVLFALDPVNGGVRFARRYKRQGKTDNMMQRFGNQTKRLVANGWSEDIVIPYGNWLVLFASDREEVLAVDRSSGDMIWKCKFKPTIGHKVEYLIGIYDDYLYCGGSDTVCAIHLEGQGRWVWGGFGDEFAGDKSYGRGFLTSSGLYVPVKDSILKLDLKTGKEISRVGVRLPDGSPVGNLYSDGQRIWVHGGNRLYALKPADPEDEGSQTKSKTDETEEGSGHPSE